LFLTRLLTAAVLLAAFLAALFWLDRALFALLAALIVALAGYEWATLGKTGRGFAVVYAAVCAVLCYSLAQEARLAPWVCAAAGLFWISAAPWWLARGVAPASAGLTLAAGAMVLVPAGLAMATLPRSQLLMGLGLIWIADSGAYFAGRAFGRRKLAPSISPGKTWEGVAGGAVGCVIYAIIWAFSDPELRARVQGFVWIPFLAGTLLLCALSVVGDLFESALKRQAGAKDSGKLLPGHGGVLDRIDSATATLPGALLLMQAIGAT
jgi:phosphatidate cytidylyltransferase